MFRQLLIVALVCSAGAQLVQKQKLRFKLSARGLPDKDNIGTTDPYVEIYYTENGSDKETKLGRSSTISDTENPNWGEVFEFDYDRSKGQRLQFKVKDHDNAREDDTVGKAWVIVDDYVDKGQSYTVNLSKKGTLSIQSADPVVQQVQTVPQVVQVQQPQVIQTQVVPQPQVVQPQVVQQQPQFLQPQVLSQPQVVQQPQVLQQQVLPQPQVVQPQVVQQPQVSQPQVIQQPQVFTPQVVQQPQQVIQPVQPQTVILQQPGVQYVQSRKLRFQLSARGLPDTDVIGTVDPYVKAFYTDNLRTSETLFGRTAPLSDEENPNFKEVLEFDYVPGTNQKWRFQILDNDDNRRDDDVGAALISVDDYVKNGENSVLNLSKGQLIVKRA